MEALWDALLEPFRFSFMLRALAVAVLVGVMCPLLGGYVITRGLAFMSDGLAHAVMPGLIVGFLLGINPLLGALPIAVAMAVTVGAIERRTGVSADTAIGIMFAGSFALGLVLLKLTPALPVSVEDLLLGQILGVSAEDVWITGGLAVVVLATLTLLHKELVFVSFDPVGAQVAGLKTTWLDHVLFVLLAVVVVLTLQAVGTILVMAMLVVPAATAYQVVRSFVPMLLLSVGLGVLAAVAGLYSSFYLNLPSGPAMTLIATALFMLVTFGARARSRR